MRKFKFGFTLAEMLVAALVLAVILAIALPSVTKKKVSKFEEFEHGKWACKYMMYPSTHPTMAYQPVMEGGKPILFSTQISEPNEPLPDDFQANGTTLNTNLSGIGAWKKYPVGTTRCTRPVIPDNIANIFVEVYGAGGGGTVSKRDPWAQVTKVWDNQFTDGVTKPTFIVPFTSDGYGLDLCHANRGVSQAWVPTEDANGDGVKNYLDAAIIENKTPGGYSGGNGYKDCGDVLSNSLDAIKVCNPNSWCFREFTNQFWPPNDTRRQSIEYLDTLMPVTADIPTLNANSTASKKLPANTSYGLGGCGCCGGRAPVITAPEIKLAPTYCQGEECYNNWKNNMPQVYQVPQASKPLGVIELLKNSYKMFANLLLVQPAYAAGMTHAQCSEWCKTQPIPDTSPSYNYGGACWPSTHFRCWTRGEIKRYSGGSCPVGMKERYVCSVINEEGTSDTEVITSQDSGDKIRYVKDSVTDADITTIITNPDGSTSPKNLKYWSPSGNYNRLVYAGETTLSGNILGFPYVKGNNPTYMFEGGSKSVSPLREEYTNVFSAPAQILFPHFPKARLLNRIDCWGEDKQICSMRNRLVASVPAGTQAPCVYGTFKFIKGDRISVELNKSKAATGGKDFTCTAGNPTAINKQIEIDPIAHNLTMTDVVNVLNKMITGGNMTSNDFMASIATVLGGYKREVQYGSNKLTCSAGKNGTDYTYYVTRNIGGVDVKMKLIDLIGGTAGRFTGIFAPAISGENGYTTSAEKDSRIEGFFRESGVSTGERDTIKVVVDKFRYANGCPGESGYVASGMLARSQFDDYYEIGLGGAPGGYKEGVGDHGGERGGQSIFSGIGASGGVGAPKDCVGAYNNVNTEELATDAVPAKGKGQTNGYAKAPNLASYGGKGGKTVLLPEGNPIWPQRNFSKKRDEDTDPIWLKSDDGDGNPRWLVENPGQGQGGMIVVTW